MKTSNLYKMAFLLFTLCKFFTLVLTRFSLEFKQQQVSSDFQVTQSAGAAEYTDCISEKGKETPTSVLDMALSNLMARIQ